MYVKGFIWNLHRFIWMRNFELFWPFKELGMRHLVALFLVHSLHNCKNCTLPSPSWGVDHMCRLCICVHSHRFVWLILIYDRISFGPDLVNNNSMRHPCSLRKVPFICIQQFFQRRRKSKIINPFMSWAPFMFVNSAQHQ